MLYFLQQKHTSFPDYRKNRIHGKINHGAGPIASVFFKIMKQSGLNSMLSKKLVHKKVQLCELQS